MAYIFHYGDAAGDFATGIAQAYGQQVAQAAQRRQAIEQQALEGQLAQAHGQLARTQEIGLRDALGRHERADQQAFTLQRDANEQQNRLAAQQNQVDLRTQMDQQERAARGAQYAALLRKFPDLAQDPEAAIAELDFIEGRGLNTFLNIRQRREAEKAKAAQRAQEGTAAVELFRSAAQVPGALPAGQQGPPSPEAQAGAAQNAAMENLLRTNPKLVDDPFVRQRMGMLSATERLSEQNLDLRQRQEDRLESEAAARDPVMRELRSQRDLASRELARAYGNKFLDPDVLTAAQEKLRAAQERIDQRMQQFGSAGNGETGRGAGPMIEQPPPGTAPAQDGLGPVLNPGVMTPGQQGGTGGGADGLPPLIPLRAPGGGVDEVPQAFVADQMRQLIAEIGPQEFNRLRQQPGALRSAIERLWLERKVRMGKAPAELLRPGAPPAANALDEVTRGMMAGGGQ